MYQSRDFDFTRTPWLIDQNGKLLGLLDLLLNFHWFHIKLRKLNWSLIFKFLPAEEQAPTLWGNGKNILFCVRHYFRAVRNAKNLQFTFSKDMHDWYISYLPRTYFTLNDSTSVYSFDSPSLIPKENIDWKLSALPVRGSRNIDLSVDSDQIRCLNNWLLLSIVCPSLGINFMEFSLELCPRIVGWKINENLTAFPNYWLQAAKKI